MIADRNVHFPGSLTGASETFGKIVAKNTAKFLTSRPSDKKEKQII
jgi:hypothetical protein